MKPDFIGIGLARAGTTWLWQVLGAHPDTVLPPVKEWHYFDEKPLARKHQRQRIAEKLEKKVQAVKDQMGESQAREWLQAYVKHTDRRIDRYRELFDALPGGVTGEITPSYATLPEDEVRRLVEGLPDTKFILCLRNPVERELSHAVFSLGRRNEAKRIDKDRIGQLTSEDLIEFLAGNKDRMLIDVEAVVERWSRLAGRDRLLLVFQQDIDERPGVVAKNVCKFLGLTFDRRHFKSVLRKRVNKTPRDKSQFDAARQFLARHYQESVRRLATSYKGPYVDWLFEVERVLESRGEEADKAAGPVVVRKEDGKLPDFLGIGAARSGTTWLYVNLRSHPSVWVTPAKEVHYFDSKSSGKWTHPDRLYGRWLRSDRRNNLERPWYDFYREARPKDDDWYRALFSPAGDRLAGEVTPSYCTLGEKEVREIHALMPETRILFNLRNPIDRAISHVLFRATRQPEKGPIERYLAENLSDETILDFLKGEGKSHLISYRRVFETWADCYGLGDRFHVVFQDDIGADPLAVLQDVCRYLEIEYKREHFGGWVSRGRNAAKASADDLPATRKYLAGFYEQDLNLLRNLFGEKVQAWVDDAERLRSA